MTDQLLTQDELDWNCKYDMHRYNFDGHCSNCNKPTPPIPHQLRKLTIVTEELQ